MSARFESALASRRGSGRPGHGMDGLTSEYKRHADRPGRAHWQARQERRGLRCCRLGLGCSWKQLGSAHAWRPRIGGNAEEVALLSLNVAGNLITAADMEEGVFPSFLQADCAAATPCSTAMGGELEVVHSVHVYNIKIFRTVGGM